MKFNQLGSTGVLISEICLGTMTYGGKGSWTAIGELPLEDVTLQLKDAINHGINFIDTANVYSEGQSEILLGQSLKNLGINRQELVIATKVRGRMGSGANQVGLSRLHILDSVEDSLKRLQINHIDLLYIHGVDTLTPLEETMRGLEDVVRAGKVRYLGISNHPAWMIMKANAYAELKNMTKFVALQHFYSIAGRDIEREVVPLALSENLSIMPWSPLAGGFLSGKYTRNSEKTGENRRDSFDFPPIDKEKAFDIIDVMTAISQQHNVSPAQVALAWILKKPGVSSVIIGAKKHQQLLDNIAATELILSDEDQIKLNEISALKPEYPGWMVDRQGVGRKPE